jgi:signal recognition particle receptor subunit beta
MAFVNFSTREILVKIVYYGPGLGGKTTSLQYIYNSLPGTHRGKMISLATDEDRTIYFDFLPVYLGKLQGFTVRLQLYTVPGQVRYNQTRRLVLKGVDGVVFVADLQRHRKFSNIESYQNLEENLAYYGLQLAQLPHVIQYNKIDLPNIMPVEELNEVLNKYQAPYFRTCATTGEGVLDALTTISKMVFDDLRKRGLRDVSKPPAPEAAERLEEKPPTAPVEVVDVTAAGAEALSPTPSLAEIAPEEIEVTDDELAVIEPAVTETFPSPVGSRPPAPSEAILEAEDFSALEESEAETFESVQSEPPPPYRGEETVLMRVPPREEPESRAEIPPPRRPSEIPTTRIPSARVDWWWAAVPEEVLPLWQDVQYAWQDQDPAAFRISFQSLYESLSHLIGTPPEALLPEAVRMFWPMARQYVETQSIWTEDYTRWGWLLLWGLGWVYWFRHIAGGPTR